MQMTKTIVLEKLKIALWKVENIAGKREKAFNQKLLLLQQCFPKLTFQGGITLSQRNPCI